MEWGPLQPILSLLVSQESKDDNGKTSKTLDMILAQALNGEELTAAVRASSLAQLDQVLDHEPLAGLSLSFLMLLSAKASKLEHARQEEDMNEIQTKFLRQMAQLLHKIPMSVAAKELKRLSVLCDQYARQAVGLQQSLKIIFPLRSFLQRFHEQEKAVLTPLHAQYLYLCLHSKCYFAAIEILDQTLIEVHSQSHLVTCVDFLGYAYYGGLLYLGEKRYQDSLDFFQLVVTAPAISLSAFVIEAYKLMALVTLIVKGERVSLPKYTPFVVVRHVESHCAAYNDLVNAFVNDKEFAAVEEVVAKNIELFTQERNFGLVKQVVHAFKQRKVLQLKRTYATIELTQIATTAGMVNSNAVAAEKMLLSLISTGRMDAIIDQQKAMVRFVLEKEDCQDNHDEFHGEVTLRLQEEMEKLVLVASHLRYIDVELVTSAKFQSRLQKDKDRRSKVAMHTQQSEDRTLGEIANGMDTME
ncbi:cop9 signalosome complex subunit [Plasmopara halstedii]|uniref:COP9 signalosome complex subunit 3 n=1 Tax=Plasmopara halstedii TaxID=4781 RepID=A0A0P1AAT4_PLAHL|nr:cop9 signalosome complex subunit [Plasmopara halstedii]CEG37944.1 cop9 signalosome complex subunit [Plasmopara halstedii]|eukprot:XP_024574313.1 cop9 signalosome complex subunit [Plasmopara halstedii]